MDFNNERTALFCYIAAAFLAGAIAGTVTLPSVVNAQARAQKTTRLMTTDLAGWCDGKEAVIEYSEEAPGPGRKHYHPGHSFTYMIEGSRTVTIDGMTTEVVPAGGVHYEAPMQANVSNNGSPARVVTFRILEKGKEETVVAP